MELTTMVLKVARFVNLISPEEWREPRECWERLHTARALLNVVGLSLLYPGALREKSLR